MESETNIWRVGHKKTVCAILAFRSFCEVGPQLLAKLLCTQGCLSTNWASPQQQQQHRPCVGFCLSSPPWGKGPLLRKSKVTISFTSMDTILSSILFCSLSCKNNPVFPLERGWNCSKSKWLYVRPYESLPPAWGPSQKERVAVTAVHKTGWVVLRTLLSSVIGRLQQFWPETKLLRFLDIVGTQDPFSLSFTQDMYAARIEHFQN